MLAEPRFSAGSALARTVPYRLTGGTSMVTARTHQLMFLGTLAAAMGCGPTVEGGGSMGQPTPTPIVTPTPTPTPMPPPDPTELKYPGHGFIVHEWGTDTIVVGSNGSLQRGLHHEEEDLPGFVYDRVKAGSLDGSSSVEVKMETPVTYFYADTPLTAKVAVTFPAGVFTQWYPAVSSFYPKIVDPKAYIGGMPLGSFRDPV